MATVHDNLNRLHFHSFQKFSAAFNEAFQCLGNYIVNLVLVGYLAIGMTKEHCLDEIFKLWPLFLNFSTQITNSHTE